MIFRMVHGAGLLLLLNLAFVQMVIRPDSDCDFTESLGSQQIKFFKNPHWPATYLPGSTCRWTFKCPMRYACRLRCRDVGLPQTDDCYMDKLLVSGSGNSQLEGAQVFCGRTEINFRSVGSRMTLALVTSQLSPGGRFRCTIKSEPWSQPWFVSPCTSKPDALEGREGSTPEEKEPIRLEKKINTPARVNHKLDVDHQRETRVNIPHTGLIQSKAFIVYEPERTPHAKNVKGETSNTKYIDTVSSQVKYVPVETTQPRYIKVEHPFTGQVEEETPFSNSIQGAYRDHVDDKVPHAEKVHAITQARHVKTGLPVAKSFKVQFPNANRIKVDDSPFADRVEEVSQLLDIVEAEHSLTKPVKAGLPYDRRVHRRSDSPRRKNKIQHSLSSHIKRTHRGSRRVKQVQPGTRHVRHELIRAPKVHHSRRMKAGLTRITHHTGLPHTRRVRTQIKRSTKRPRIAPYKRGIRRNNGEPVDVFSGTM